MDRREAVALLLQAETAVHPGAGDIEAGIDLPIQRSPVTQWPVIHDSTLRGGLRRMVNDPNDYFGVENGGGEGSHSGAIATPDVELLLFPVASAKGIFAWITCKQALQAFVRRLELFESFLSDSARALLNGSRDQKGLKAIVGVLPTRGHALVGSKCAIQWETSDGMRVVIESDDFQAEKDNAGIDALVEWIGAHALPSVGEYWAGKLAEHLVVLPAEAFTYYVRTKTDIRTRIHVDEGRAENLWTEENVPIDSVFYTVLLDLPRDPHDKLSKDLAALTSEMGLSRRPVVQLGGDQGLGRGWLRLRALGGE